MSKLLTDLEPYTRERAEKLLETRSDIRITWALRSDDEQLHLWAQGRRRTAAGLWVIVEPRLVVTKAMPGWSPHNEVVDGKAAAFDICFRGDDPYLHAYAEAHDDAPDPRWLVVGTVGTRLGLNWGGPLGDGDRFRWDSPHFENPHWRELRRG